MRVVLAALWVAVACASQAQGMEPAVPRTYPYNIPTPLADDPSAFVHVPARVGFYGGMLMGLGPGVMLGVPVALVERVTAGQASQFSADLMGGPSVYSGVVMHYAAGMPFYLTKVVFWDLPHRVAGRRR